MLKHVILFCKWCLLVNYAIFDFTTVKIVIYAEGEVHVFPHPALHMGGGGDMR